MASTSAGGSTRIATAVTTLHSDNQALIADIRKAISVIKGIAVDLEKGNEHDKVKELEEALLELLAASDDCAYFSSAIESVGNAYQPKDELTDFKKLLEDEVANLKRNSPSAPQNQPLYRQFKEAIWNVHHAGQPMPGEEQEDIIMTNTENNLLNITCPLSGKPVIQLESPVRSVDCKHIYERNAVMHYMKSRKSGIQCPIAGCPKKLVAGRVLCDPLLLVDIDEMRLRSTQTVQATIVQDFTELDEDEN